MAWALPDAILESMESATEHSQRRSATRALITRIAVGVDGFHEGEDAAALGTALAHLTGAELLLVTVHADPVVLPPVGLNWASLRKEAEAMLQKARVAKASGARTVVETDLSVPRGLQRVVEREHRDLLVMGSSRHAPDGRTRIGKRTRQLLCHFGCPLAVAPRGFRTRTNPGFRRIGVGFDGGAESRAALELAASVALAATATLDLYAVVDDRIPPIGWSGGEARAAKHAPWEDAVVAESARRRTEAEAAALATGASSEVEVKRGRPADALLELSPEVDLLVIGSRRWGAMARLLLGSTGEAVLHDAASPVLVVPRPAS